MPRNGPSHLKYSVTPRLSPSFWSSLPESTRPCRGPCRRPRARPRARPRSTGRCHHLRRASEACGRLGRERLGERVADEDVARTGRLLEDDLSDLDGRQVRRLAFQWDLALEDAPTDRRFDAIFFSEVIEHLPVPGHIALRRLRTLLRSGGLLFCSTPNLYRLRNIVYLIRGRPLFDHFELPGERGYGHVLEDSAEHLAWQVPAGRLR